MIVQPTKIDFTLGEMINALSRVIIVRLSRNLNENWNSIFCCHGF